MSTFDGLARFDGVRFTIFDKGNTKGIVNNRFARLFVDRKGVLYSFTEDNVVTVYRNQAFVSYSQFAIAGERVVEIVSDDKGNTIVETDRGYYSLQGDQFVPTADRKEANVKQIYWSKSAKWVIERNQVTRHRDGQVTTYPLNLTQEELSPGNDLVLLEDRQGALWMRRRTPSFELWRLQGGKSTVFSEKEVATLSDLYPNHAWEDANGKVYFLFSGLNVPKPIQLVSFNGDHFTSYQLKETVGVSSSFIDREDNFWLATSTGLRRLRRTLITTLSVKDGLNSNEVYPLLQAADGAIFIGSVLGLNRYADGKITNAGLTYSNSLPLYLRGLWEDDQARLWLGFQGEGGFGRLETPSSLKRIGKTDPTHKDRSHHRDAENAENFEELQGSEAR